MCALPTLSAPNFTSYSSRSPGPNGTLARFAVDARGVRRDSFQREAPQTVAKFLVFFLFVGTHLVSLSVFNGGWCESDDWVQWLNLGGQPRPV